MDKPRRSFWQIWNMSFGFLGIQFGWGLQMANMSAIYQFLGARPDEIPILWLAAPMTGLIVQPLIGRASDRTWGPLGRRRPYFLVGAIFSSLALLAMPNSSALWMAAGLLWILDASINVSMEPFRAFVADLLPEEQRTRGFAMQSLFIGLGAVIASGLPWLMTNVFGVPLTAGTGAVPASVRYAFYVGAAAFFGAVLWTVISTREYPPENLEEFRRAKQQRTSVASYVSELYTNIRRMPDTMKQLALVQLCTWLGLFCMFLYLTPAIARHVFNAADETSPLYEAGVQWGGVCNGWYNGVCFAFALVLPLIARKIGRKTTHTLCLLIGAAGLTSIGFISDKNLLLLSMTGVGIAWASILSMPYAILSAALPPEKTGVYMGIFNFFIVIPEIVAALAFGPVMRYLLDNNMVNAVMIGGVFMALAAVLVLRVYDPLAERERAARLAAVPAK